MWLGTVVAKWVGRMNTETLIPLYSDGSVTVYSDYESTGRYVLVQRNGCAALAIENTCVWGERIRAYWAKQHGVEAMP